MHLRAAIQHTLHCLLGCGIGEVLGSVIGAGAHLPNVTQTALAIALAFVFGYSLTYWGSRRLGMSPSAARATALRTDTVSIISMEIIDSTLEWLIPGAMNAAVSSLLFWWSLAVSLGVAFVLTVPVNFALMKRGSHAHMHH